MKITRSRLIQIIKEEILNEQAVGDGTPPIIKPAAHGAVGRPGLQEPLEALMRYAREMDAAAQRGDTENVLRNIQDILRQGEELRRTGSGTVEPDIADVEDWGGDSPEPGGGFTMAPGSEDHGQVTSPHHTYGLSPEEMESGGLKSHLEESKLKRLVKKELLTTFAKK